LAHRTRRLRAVWSLALGLTALGGWVMTRLADPEIAVDPPAYLVGAYYYTWYYPGHWASNGYLGRDLAEPLEPLLGEYLSDDPAVVASHLKWASEYGIDFFIISWSHAGSFADQTARKYLLPAMAESGIRQAPTVELMSYGERDLGNPEFRRRLAADLRFVGEHYLKHPSALRIDGRPVLFLYVTRVLRGNVGSWIDEVRRMLAAIGVDPFVVADEVFWHEPEPDRLRAFDAITAYNVYDWPRTDNAGLAGDSTFLTDVEGLFARWQAAAQAAGVRFVPNAMPGYNDRGVRPGEDHYVIPRRFHPTASITSLFERSIDLARRFVDPTVPMVTITSFNEWHEWTQVEPARPANRPPSRDPAAFTQGFPHDPYTFEYLEVIRDRLGGSPPPTASGDAEP
jgi:glycoprotein endo-alpha-1,2-mannosidase